MFRLFTIRDGLLSCFPKPTDNWQHTEYHRHDKPCATGNPLGATSNREFSEIHGDSRGNGWCAPDRKQTETRRSEHAKIHTRSTRAVPRIASTCGQTDENWISLSPKTIRRNRAGCRRQVDNISWIFDSSLGSKVYDGVVLCCKSTQPPKTSYPEKVGFGRDFGRYLGNLGEGIEKRCFD